MDDADNDPNAWTAKVVVYDSDTCANPNQSITVIGFATIVIENVVGAPNPTVQGRVICDFVDPVVAVAEIMGPREPSRDWFNKLTRQGRRWN